MNKCDPRAPFELWLSVFDDADAAARPTFTYRRVSSAEFDRMDDLYRSVAETGEVKASNAKLIEIAAIGLIDWKNQVDVESGEAIPFDASKLRSVINHIEANELIGKRFLAASLKPEDKKKLDSPA